MSQTLFDVGDLAKLAGIRKHSKTCKYTLGPWRGTRKELADLKKNPLKWQARHIELLQQFAGLSYRAFPLGPYPYEMPSQGWVQIMFDKEAQQNIRWAIRPDGSHLDVHIDVYNKGRPQGVAVKVLQEGWCSVDNKLTFTPLGTSFINGMFAFVPHTHTLIMMFAICAPVAQFKKLLYKEEENWVAYDAHMAEILNSHKQSAACEALLTFKKVSKCSCAPLLTTLIEI